MRGIRLRRVVPLVVLGLLVVLGAWVGWQAYQVNKELNQAVGAVDDLRAAADVGDTARMDEAIDRLEMASAAADDRTSGVIWGLLTHVPVYGDDARGIEVVSGVVHDLAVDGARPVVEVSQSLDDLLPRDGQVSVAAVEDLQAPVARADSALAAAEASLDAEDPTDFVVRLRDQYRELSASVRDAHAAMSSASTALEVLPTMLGSGGPRNYLVVFQNNAEIRATGGLPGAALLVGVGDGRVAIERQVASNTLQAPRPILPQTAGEKALYGTFLGRFFINSTMTPDFPRAAELMRAWWTSAYPEEVDGVISIDPVALSFILRATGPVQVGDDTLDADNVVDQLLHEVYLRYEDPAAQDAFFQQVTRVAFERILGGADDPQALVRALGRGADQSRIYVHSFDPTEQAVLDGTDVAGELVRSPEVGPQVTVALNDATQSKMSYYLRYDVNVAATACVDGVQSYTGEAVLESIAPDDVGTQPEYITGGGFAGADPGVQFLNIQVFAPVGGTLSGLRADSQRIPFSPVDFGGRSADYFSVQLAPGEKVRLAWRMTSGPGQTAATEVSVTPGIEDRSQSSTVASAC